MLDYKADDSRPPSPLYRRAIYYEAAIRSQAYEYGWFAVDEETWAALATFGPESQLDVQPVL